MKSKHVSVVTTYSFQRERSSALQSVLATHRSRAAEVADTARTLNWGSPLPAATSPAKRIIDIAGALVGLCIVAVLILPIAIVIRYDSPGPLFFRQLRYGYRGKPFLIWKFRSMVSDADANQHRVQNEARGLIFKNRADPESDSGRTLFTTHQPRRAASVYQCAAR